MPVMDRVRSAWNAFRSSGDTQVNDYSSGSIAYGAASPSRARPIFTINDRSLIPSIYTRISIDVASYASLRHIKVDDEGDYVEDVESHFNDCLTFEPNLDQGPRAFIQDIVLSMFDKGSAAIVPVDTTVDPNNNSVIDIYTMRVGEIQRWLPQHVKVHLYNETTGNRESITLEKRYVAIVENPLYNVMNEPNSTLQRLSRKLTLLDTIDEQSSSGKLDIIIQLPYVIRSEARREAAEKRREEIEFQLKNSKYGIAYADGTEKITQLNRPAENNLLAQVEYLVGMLYGQLGITEDVMNGTADEKTMTNYFNRTIEPITGAIVEAMQRAFVGSPTVKKERVHYFKEPFRFVSIADFAEIADKLTRNEVVSANELRSFIGIKPSTDPKADQLINSNMPVKDAQVPPPPVYRPSPSK